MRKEQELRELRARQEEEKKKETMEEIKRKQERRKMQMQKLEEQRKKEEREYLEDLVRKEREREVQKKIALERWHYQKREEERKKRTGLRIKVDRFGNKHFIKGSLGSVSRTQKKHKDRIYSSKNAGFPLLEQDSFANYQMAASRVGDKMLASHERPTG